MEQKTVEQIKDLVAKRYGYENWQDYFDHYSKHPERYDFDKLINESMREYATQSNQANGGEGKGFSLDDVNDAYHSVQYGNPSWQDIKQYLLSLTPSIPSSKGAFSVEDVIKAMDISHQEGLLYGRNPNYKSPLQDYKTWITNNLTPQSHQPEVKDSWDEILNKFHASNSSDESGYMLIEWLKENYNTPFQSSTKTNSQH